MTLGMIAPLGSLAGLVALALLARRARRRSDVDKSRSRVADYRIAENSWRVLVYLALLIGIGVVLLMNRR